MRLKEWVNHRSHVYIAATVISLILSIWAAFKSAVINPDAICYVLSAESLKTDSVSSIMHLCAQAQWPFYSYLIYLVSSFTHLSYVASAYTLNGLFSLLSVLFFIKIVETLGGSLRTLWFAALVILLSHEFTNVREYIIRDHGFWAFYLGSLLSLLQFYRQPRFQTALIWAACCVLATLFRIEGAVFFLLVPLTAFMDRSCSFSHRIKHFFMLNVVLILGVACAGLWLYFHTAISIGKVGRLHELAQQVHSGLLVIADQYRMTRTALASYVLSTDAVVHSDMILCALFVGWYAISLILNISWIYAAILIYGIATRATRFASTDRMVLLWYLFINVVITFSFLLERLFLSKRYLIALSLVLMVWVPFILNTLAERAKQSNKHRFVCVIVWICIFISALGGIFEFGYSKAYIRNAGRWLATNVPSSASIYTNDLQIMYYSNHFGTQIFTLPRDFTQLTTIQHARWKKFDYLALRLNNKSDAAANAILKNIHLLPVEVYTNNRGDRVVIYKVRA